MPAPRQTRVLLAFFVVLTSRARVGLGADASADGHRRSAERAQARRPAAVARRPRASLYTLGEADWKSGRRVSHIWRVKVDGGPPIQLTSGAEARTRRAGRRTGRRSRSRAKRAGDDAAQIYLLPVDGGEARAV